MNRYLTEYEKSMEEWYFSATDEKRESVFAEKVDDALGQVRKESLGRFIKSVGFDEDRDFTLLVDKTRVDGLRRIAITHRLVLYRLG